MFWILIDLSLRLGRQIAILITYLAHCVPSITSIGVRTSFSWRSLELRRVDLWVQTQLYNSDFEVFEIAYWVSLAQVRCIWLPCLQLVSWGSQYCNLTSKVIEFFILLCGKVYCALVLWLLNSKLSEDLQFKTEVNLIAALEFLGLMEHCDLQERWLVDPLKPIILFWMFTASKMTF